MQIFDLAPDADFLLQLDPDELGIRMLPVIASWTEGMGASQLSIGHFINSVRPQSLPSGYHPSFAARSNEILQAVHEAWAWLVGAAYLVPDQNFAGSHDVKVLSRKARRLVKEQPRANSLKQRSLSSSDLHPSIRDDVWQLFHRGKYDTAVFEAMKGVEVAVRSAAELTDKDLGVGLMRKAFEKNNGPLADMTMDEGEREARAHLFAGAIGSYKNPHSHRNVQLSDSNEAAEIILLASHLLRIVEARRDARRQRIMSQTDARKG